MTASNQLILHSYWRSSASYRVRMALNLKGMAYRIEPVHLVRDGGQQYASEYTALNPQQLVPTLVHGDTVIRQSMAMLEYLEEIGPASALLPEDAIGRAQVRAIANAIACDIHPLNNLRVLKYLVGKLGAEESEKMAWYRHWTETGLAAVEAMLGECAGRYCHGDQISIADCCLLPQVYNAHRFGCDLSGFENVRRICTNLDSIDAIVQAAPENQPDAE